MQELAAIYAAKREVVMRWQQLFADLQAQFEEAEAAAERAESASRVRAELGAVRLADRLRGALGSAVTLRCRGAGPVTGVLADCGPDWLLLDGDRGTELLVAAAAVLEVSGLGRRTAVPAEATPVQARLDLRRALRALARDRSAVVLVLEDGAVLTGTIDRVGADFVELADHPAGELRRPGAVRGVRAVVIEAVVVVRTVRPALD
jgi:anti-sigma-K factor RskA